MNPRVATGLGLLVLALVAVVLLTTTNSNSSFLETIHDQPCETSSAAAKGIRASFVTLIEKLEELKGKMEMALKQADCANVLQLVDDLQRVQGEFTAVREDYQNLSAEDQEQVNVCFEKSLLPTSESIEQYVVKALTQCASSNPHVAAANALIDEAVQRINAEASAVPSKDCVELDNAMDEFSKGTSDFETHLSAILSVLAGNKMDVEQKLILMRADHLLLQATDAFYEAWESKWEGECELDADIIFDGGKITENEPASSHSAEDDEVDRAAGGGAAEAHASGAASHVEAPVVVAAPHVVVPAITGKK